MSGIIGRFLARCLLATAALLAVGCSELATTGRVVATPFTVVRDTVDAPVVSVTNVFEFFADNTRPARAPGAGVGWSWRGGFNFGIGYDLSFFLFKGASWVFGAVDYVVCRSVWPNYPNGLSPWREKGQSWSSLYYPSTRALWAKPDQTPAQTNKTPPRPVRNSPAEAVDKGMAPYGSGARSG